MAQQHLPVQSGGRPESKNHAHRNHPRYSYDAQGNLRNVTLENGKTITYAIDPANRRTGKSVNGQLQWQLVWLNGLRPLARLKADNTLDETYYYGDKPNVPEAMTTADGKTYRIISDQNGSVRLVIDASTGAVAQEMEYDTWGQVINDTNPGFQPFGFAGGLYDPDTGLTRFGARDYDAETGRWTAKDPILFGGGDSNFYGYVLQDPVNFIDPSGLSGNQTDLPFNAPHNNSPPLLCQAGRSEAECRVICSDLALPTPFGNWGNNFFRCLNHS